MSRTLTLPHPPEVPRHVPEARLQPPVVYVEPVWQYRVLGRRLRDQAESSEAELNALGAEGWELLGVVSEAGVLRLYFKRLAH